MSPLKPSSIQLHMRLVLTKQGLLRRETAYVYKLRLPAEKPVLLSPGDVVLVRLQDCVEGLFRTRTPPRRLRVCYIEQHDLRIVPEAVLRPPDDLTNRLSIRALWRVLELGYSLLIRVMQQATTHVVLTLSLLRCRFGSGVYFWKYNPSQVAEIKLAAAQPLLQALNLAVL